MTVRKGALAYGWRRLSNRAYWSRRRRAPHVEPRGKVYVGRGRAESEWRWAILTPDGRLEWGEAESRKDAWADATQVLRNARGYR